MDVIIRPASGEELGEAVAIDGDACNRARVHSRAMRRMRAFVLTRYGGPAVAELRDERPAATFGDSPTPCRRQKAASAGYESSIPSTTSSLWTRCAVQGRYARDARAARNRAADRHAASVA